MAIDTRNKRASAIFQLFPVRIRATPDGTIDALDRQQTAYIYRGIAAGGGTPPVTAVAYLIPWVRRKRGRR